MSISLTTSFQVSCLAAEYNALCGDFETFTTVYLASLDIRRFRPDIFFAIMEWCANFPGECASAEVREIEFQTTKLKCRYYLKTTTISV